MGRYCCIHENIVERFRKAFRFSVALVVWEMIKGIGVDIIDMARFEKINDKKSFLRQVFTTDEIENGKHVYEKNKHWARLFVIKETLFKAFKIGLRHGSYWQHIKINSDFVVTLSEYFKKIYDRKTKIFAAHSCSKKYAASIAFIQHEEVNTWGILVPMKKNTEHSSGRMQKKN